MAGKFEIYRDRSDKWRWRLKGENGQVIASGSSYETRGDCVNGCDAVVNAAESAQIVPVNGE